MAGSVVAGAIVMKAIDWLFARRKNRAETDANVELLQSLREGLDRQGQRIRAMEESHTQLSLRLDQEITARQAAQEEAHKLRMRVHVLESAMRQVGMVIPAETHP